MPMNHTFNHLITHYGISGKDWPVNILLPQSYDTTTSLVPFIGIRPNAVERALKLASLMSPRVALRMLVGCALEGYEAELEGALSLRLTDHSIPLHVGWTATIQGILRVVYLSPDYLDPSRHGVFGDIDEEEALPTFDFTHHHLRAFLAAAQTQLDDTKLPRLDGVRPPQEVSHSNICRSVLITNAGRFLCFSRIRPSLGLGGLRSRRTRRL